ncbi:unnamed protein product [Triticum turgidum subsp. durum]|uniref:Uncharacterized protein n=1 Tax=Triticum turgidum subsp. durum TaxID=4567 RepID=A0A9R1NJA6_TRITD|nr:unnamed protein product [Triticum turgidum subsp. durum]
MPSIYYRHSRTWGHDDHYHIGDHHSASDMWQVNIIVDLCFLIILLCLQLFFFSSVIGSVGDGSWVLLIFAAICTEGLWDQVEVRN